MRYLIVALVMVGCVDDSTPRMQPPSGTDAGTDALVTDAAAPTVDARSAQVDARPVDAAPPSPDAQTSGIVGAPCTVTVLTVNDGCGSATGNAQTFLTCVDGHCARCGYIGQPCCHGKTAPPALISHGGCLSEPSYFPGNFCDGIYPAGTTTFDDSTITTGICCDGGFARDGGVHCINPPQ